MMLEESTFYTGGRGGGILGGKDYQDRGGILSVGIGGH